MEYNYLSKTEVCEMLDISSPTLRKWIEEDDFPCRKKGKIKPTYWFIEKEIEEWIDGFKINPEKVSNSTPLEKKMEGSNEL